MATDDNAFGAAERLGVVLPAPCVGHPLKDQAYNCANEGTVLLSTIIADEHGLPMPVLITVCPQHVRATEHWLKTQGIGDPVDRWAVSTFFEHASIFESAGVDWHVLKSA